MQQALPELVRDFSRWPRLEGCLRITVGTSEETDLLLAALRSALEPDAMEEEPE